MAERVARVADRDEVDTTERELEDTIAAAVLVSSRFGEGRVGWGSDGLETERVACARPPGDSTGSVSTETTATPGAVASVASVAELAGAGVATSAFGATEGAAGTAVAGADTERGVPQPGIPTKRDSQRR